MKEMWGKVKKSLWLRLIGIILLFVLLAGILISGSQVYEYQREGYYDIENMEEEFAYSASAKGIAVNYIDEIKEGMTHGFPSSGVWMIKDEQLDRYLMTKNFDCWIYQEEEGKQSLRYSSANIGNDAYPEWEKIYTLNSAKENSLTIRIQLKMSWEEADRFLSAYERYVGDYEDRYNPVVRGVLFTAAFLLMLRFFVIQRNWKSLHARVKELAVCRKEGWTEYLPLDLVVLAWFAGLIAAWYATDALVDEISIQYWNKTYDLLFWQNIYVTIVLVVLELFLTVFLVWMIVVRKRQGTMKKRMVCLWIRDLWYRSKKHLDGLIGGKIPFWVRMCSRFFGVIVLEFLTLMIAAVSDVDLETWMFCFCVMNGILLFLTAKRGMRLQKVLEGAEAIAEGDLSYQINTKGMKGECLELAEHLNSIGEGMAKAVHESIKSERMKTELITNVSHDIKTPLTSIINYVDLLQKEHTPEQEKEYLEVLVRQSGKLKKLTEDVLEASKAASGNVEVHLVPLSFKEVVNQAAAEYESKLAESDLKLVWKMPEEDLNVMADGKLMWRVLDNLFGNVCKYSLKSTRVYVEVARFLDQVTMTMKNVSAEELNVSAEELTERFVRGDKSRSTEGSGLGLHIAMSFMKLQGGDLELEIDGDLFKVKLTMPVAEEVPESELPIV